MKIYPVFIPHAGCPHQCLFCAQDKSTSQLNIPDAETVGAYLEDVLPQQGDGEVAFYGGTFTLLPRERQQAYLAAVAPFLGQGRVAGVRVSTRPDAVAGDALELLKLSGVTTIELVAGGDVTTRDFRTAFAARYALITQLLEAERVSEYRVDKLLVATKG